jgi:hypothetical protein
METLIEIVECRNCNDQVPDISKMSWLRRELAAAVNRWPRRIAVLCVSSLLAVSARSRPAPLAATVRLTPATLAFGSQVVGTSSVSQAVTLSNEGTASLTVVKLTASGEFSETNTCAGEVAPNASCTINITFTPIGKGIRRGTLTILDNATASPHLVNLRGVGTQVKLSVDTLSFEGQPVHNPSNPKLVTLTNLGDTPLRIAAVRITPPVKLWGAPLGSSVSSSHRADEFAETNGCGTSLAPGASCTISVTFTPRRAASSTAWLIVSDDGGGSPQRVTLWGVGVRF